MIGSNTRDLMAPSTSFLKVYLKTRLDASHQSSTMDQFKDFPEHMPVTLPEKPDALEYAARQGQVRACIICQEPNTKRVFVLFCKDNCVTCRANPNLIRSSFEPFGQMLYHRMVLEPHTVYPITAGTRYILLTVQKTVIPDPTALIPVTPDLTTPQIILPDPPPVQKPDPPVVETLERTLMDDSSMDQIVSSVFENYSQQGGFPRLIPKNPRCLIRCLPCLTRVMISSRSWIILKEVGRPPSHRVWDAYQPQTTDAYILDFTECTRVADVYVKWLTWLDDWEMHRNDNVSWRMVGLQPWKRASENKEGSDPEVICITVNHAGQTSKPKDFRSNCQENVRLRLVHNPLPKNVPVEYLPFCVRGKFSQLARGNRGLMVVKEVEQQNFFKSSDYLPWPWRRCRNSKTVAMDPFPTPCMRVCTRKSTFHPAPW
ncbi:hypothetical protein TNCV_2516861 [Trichonephila clavipes]|nr:hypothetical protein TNCV_2516861 [Trichonephila clavipes]